MSRLTTNIFGILIAMIAGAYFFAAYCGSCIEEPIFDFPVEGAIESVKSGESAIAPKGKARLQPTGKDTSLPSQPFAMDSLPPATKQNQL